MKYTTLCILVLVSFSSLAQIKFEKGYFIDEENQRIDCLIKNVDWAYNPNKFEYKLYSSGEINIGTIDAVKAFEIIGYSKFIKAEVDIDRSPIEISLMDNNPKPVFNKETLFLKVLIEGSASLYSYEENNFIRFFFQVQPFPIQQLIIKEYLVGDKLGENEEYKVQLRNLVSCEETSARSIEFLSYSRLPLIRYFLNYNNCVGSESLVYQKKKQNGYFHLSVTPGFSYASLKLVNISRLSQPTAKFPSQLNFRMGIEAAYVLPFNKNKWGIVAEPNYKYFKGESDYMGEKVVVNYKSIEFPFGLRHYLFLKNNWQVMLTGYITFENMLNAKFDFENFQDIKIIGGSNFAFEAGVGHKKINLRFRWHTNKDLLSSYSGWHASYEKISLLVGYNLF